MIPPTFPNNKTMYTNPSQTSKTLNYLDHWLIGPYYAFFCMVWIYMRHYLNIRILLSLFTEFKTVGVYELNWETGIYKCDLAFWICGSLLSCLQALNLFWLFYILRIAYRFVVHNVAKDDRSDEEESEGETGDDSNTTKKLLEKDTLKASIANGEAKSFANVAATGTANGSARKR